MSKQNDLSRCLVALEQDATLIAVVEMGQASWLVAGIVPGLDRYPLKKLGPDRDALLQLLHRWRSEAENGGYAIDRIAVAYEAGRDGFWLARWLRSQSIEAHVIHPSSVPVSREHRRAKTDRLDTELLKRAFLGWLRGEPKHCSMAAIPTLEDEDARRPGRERQGQRVQHFAGAPERFARDLDDGVRPSGFAQACRTQVGVPRAGSRGGAFDQMVLFLDDMHNAGEVELNALLNLMNGEGRGRSDEAAPGCFPRYGRILTIGLGSRSLEVFKLL
jgi:hypothetical protein